MGYIVGFFTFVIICLIVAWKFYHCIVVDVPDEDIFDSLSTEDLEQIEKEIRKDYGH